MKRVIQVTCSRRINTKYPSSCGTTSVTLTPHKQLPSTPTSKVSAPVQVRLYRPLSSRKTRKCVFRKRLVVDSIHHDQPLLLNCTAEFAQRHHIRDVRACSTQRPVLPHTNMQHWDTVVPATAPLRRRRRRDAVGPPDSTLWQLGVYGYSSLLPPSPHNAHIGAPSQVKNRHRFRTRLTAWKTGAGGSEGLASPGRPACPPWPPPTGRRGASQRRPARTGRPRRPRRR